jgi:hypothetical protein
MGETRNAYKILAGKPERKRPLGRPRRRSEDDIRMAVREIVPETRRCSIAIVLQFCLRICHKESSRK